MIGSVSYWADCLSQYIKIYIYILNVKLGMPVFYTCEVVSYLLIYKVKKMASLFKVQTWVNLCAWLLVHTNKDLFKTCAFPII